MNWGAVIQLAGSALSAYAANRNAKAQQNSPTGGGAGSIVTQPKPMWFQDMQRDNLDQIYGAGMQDYTPYEGGRVAGLTGLQQDAQGAVAGLRDMWRPYAERANEYATGLQPDAFALAREGGEAAKRGTGEWEQNLDAAGEAMRRGSQGWNAGTLQQYMSPYQSAVVDEIARRGNENLTENVLPSVNSTFTGAGAFGSARNAEFTNRALRDNQREISAAQANALNQGYNAAAERYGEWADRDRSAGTGLAGLAGLQISARDAETKRLLDAANTMNTVGSGMASTQLDMGRGWQDLGGGWANMANDFGERERQINQQGLDVLYNNFAEQRDWNQQRGQWLGSQLNQYAPHVGGNMSVTQYSGLTALPKD